MTEPMTISITKDRQIELLTILATGCKKHPAYRAIRPATGNCEPCVVMWKASQTLRQSEHAKGDTT